MTNIFKTKNKVFELTLTDENDVCILTMQMEKANKINDIFVLDFEEVLDHALSLKSVTGFILASAHKEFCVGADLKLVLDVEEVDVIDQVVTSFCKSLRRLETCGKPVVCLLNGSAFGGGCELAFGCHRRIALNLPGFRIGLPEVTLGMFPGAGGSQRLPRLIGIKPALENILQGKLHNINSAMTVGFIDEVVVSREELWQKAFDWIRKNPQAKQPWDSAGFKVPGVNPNSPEGLYTFMAALAFYEKKTAGALKGGKYALMAVQEGLRVDFDSAREVERRYFKKAISGAQTKDMVRTFWKFRTQAGKLEGLPKVEDSNIRKVGIVGAGMMGAGLAAVCTKAGFEVVLTDTDEVKLTAAKERTLKYSKEKGVSLLSCVKTYEQFSECDLVIEAVSESMDLKHKVLSSLEAKLKPGVIWASNTSVLPITDLAKPFKMPSNFLGLHFFSPPEKMQLVEVITTKSTSAETLARCLAFAQALKKLPIVVNDGYGFFTSNVFFSYVLEAAELVAEGYDPLLIEWAAKKFGMVVPPLQVCDEVSLSLVMHALKESERYFKKRETPGVDLIHQMVEMKRLGKASKAGFYDYDDGRALWSGLSKLVKSAAKKAEVSYLQDRLMFAQCARVLWTVDEGIIRNFKDAELASVLGIGFAPQTGGPLTFLDRFGLKEAVLRLKELQKTHGDRFCPGKTLCRFADEGKNFII